MWYYYRTLKNRIDQLNTLSSAPRCSLMTGLLCYEISCELKKNEIWFEQQPGFWKSSVYGRNCARKLYKARRAVTAVECQLLWRMLFF